MQKDKEDFIEDENRFLIDSGMVKVTKNLSERNNKDL
jgi:hypothetical protein